MAYTYEQIFAVDEANPQNIARNSTVTIFAPGDSAKTPLTITTPDGLPLANPVLVNGNGYGSAFMHATLDRVAWEGAGFTGFFTSYDGMKNEAVAARQAAEAAAANAAAEAAAAIGVATDAATTAASEAEAAATAAASSAALVGAPADTAMAAAASNSSSQFRGALNATYAGKSVETDKLDKTEAATTYVPKWKANTAYIAGQAVLTPTGDTVTAKVAFTSGATYNAANWNYSPTYLAATPVGVEMLRTVDSPALRVFHAALANREAAPCDIVFVGDSNMEGEGSDLVRKRWQSRALESLRARFPVYGGTPTGGLNYYPGKYYTTTLPQPWTYVGSPGADNNYGLGLRNVSLSTGQSMSITVTGTSFKILYAKAGGTGTFSYQVDGGATTNINSNNGGAASGDGISASINLGGGSHTINIAYVSGGPAYINGIVVFDGDENKGIRGWDSAHYGYMTSSYNNAATQPFHQFVNIQPSLVVLGLTTNDYGSQVAPATHLANLQSLITKIKAKCTIAPSIVLLGMFKRGTVTESVAPYQSYIDNLYTIAASDSSCTVLDMTKRMQAATDNSLGLYLPDGIHINNKGHAMMGDIVAGFLAPK
ncbi:esterase [Arthrobacter phage BrayBeast]